MHIQLYTCGTVRRFATRSIGTILVAGYITGAISAHAEPVATTSTYMVSMALEAGGEKSTPRVLAKAGEQFAVASGNWRVEMTVRPGETPADVWVSSKVFKDSTLVSSPALMAHVNEKAVIKVGDNSDAFSLATTVSVQP
jgi:bla regulator protein BlaR1